MVHGSLYSAILAGNLDQVREALTKESVNEATNDGLTPLHLAVFGYSLVADSTAGNTARAQGCKLDQELIVDLLLEAGAKIDVWDNMKRLPASCCDGKRMPDALRKAMEARRGDTSNVPYNRDGKLSPEILCDHARILYEQERLSCAEIGRRLGVTRQRIHQLVMEYDFKRPRRVSREVQHKLVAALMRKGLTNDAISGRLGMSLGSLQALLITHPDYEQLKCQRKLAKRSRSVPVAFSSAQSRTGHLASRRLL